MSIKRIALYVVALVVAAFLAREPLVGAIQDWREARQRAEDEDRTLAAARWTIDWATRAAESAEPRQRIIAARVFSGTRVDEERRREDKQPAIYSQQEIDAHETRANELIRALLVDSDDEFVLWLLASECPDALDACDRALALRRLREVAGDNASVQVLALARAQDDAARREALAAGARAVRDTSYWMQGLDAALAAQAPVPIPDGAAQALGVDDSEAARTLLGMTVSLGLPLAPLSPLVEACKPEALPADDPARRDDCIAFARVLVREADTLVNYKIGLRMLRRLLAGTAEEPAVVEQLRQSEWMVSQYKEIPASDYTDAKAITQWIADWRKGGELYSVRERFRRYGIAIEAPANWMPERPEVLAP